MKRNFKILRTFGVISVLSLCCLFSQVSLSRAENIHVDTPNDTDIGHETVLPNLDSTPIDFSQYTKENDSSIIENGSIDESNFLMYTFKDNVKVVYYDKDSKRYGTDPTTFEYDKFTNNDLYFLSADKTITFYKSNVKNIVAYVFNEKDDFLSKYDLSSTKYIKNLEKLNEDKVTKKVTTNRGITSFKVGIVSKVESDGAVIGYSMTAKWKLKNTQVDSLIITGNGVKQSVSVGADENNTSFDFMPKKSGTYTFTLYCDYGLKSSVKMNIKLLSKSQNRPKKLKVTLSGVRKDGLVYGKPMHVKFKANKNCYITLNSQNLNRFTKTASYDITDNGTYNYTAVDNDGYTVKGYIKVTGFSYDVNKENYNVTKSENNKQVNTLVQTGLELSPWQIALLSVFIILCIVSIGLLVYRKRGMNNEVK